MSHIISNTYQNVNLILNTGHVSKRIFAYLLDLIFIIAISLGLIYFWTKFFSFFPYYSDIILYLVISLSLFPIYFYSFWTEFIFNGQTFGKMIMKIKVVKINGYHCGFSEYAMRWLFRTIDIYPFIFLSLFFPKLAAIGISLIGIPAFFFIVNSKEGQRLGDKLAGTTVISLKEKKDIKKLIYADVVSDYVPLYPNVIKLSDHDMKIIKDTFETCKRTKDYKTVKKLRQKVEEVMQIKSPQKDIAFIETIIKDFNYYTKRIS